MVRDCETPHFAVHYDSLYGVGYIERKADGMTTALITGTDMVELRRMLNRARTNATSKRKSYRPFAEIAEAVLSEYFPPACKEVRR